MANNRVAEAILGLNISTKETIEQFKDVIKQVQKDADKNRIQLKIDLETFTVDELKRSLTDAKKQIDNEIKKLTQHLGGIEPLSEKLEDAYWNYQDNIGSDPSIKKFRDSFQEYIRAGGEFKGLIGNLRDEIEKVYKSFSDIGEKGFIPIEKLKDGVDSIDVLENRLKNLQKVNPNLDDALGKLSSVVEDLKKTGIDISKIALFSDGGKSSDGLKETSDGIKKTIEQNKLLEEQAIKTSAAIENEGKAAQEASEKFRKLAKNKGEALYANKELAKSAIETANALEKEVELQKESNKNKQSQSKKAVDTDLYNKTYRQWHQNVYSKLLDEYGEGNVFDVKIDQLNNGMIKVSASIKDADEAWKKFSGNINSQGDLSVRTLKTMKPTEVASLEKAITLAQEIETLGAGEELFKFTNIKDMESMIANLVRETEKLSKFNETYNVSINDRGLLTITKTIKEANGDTRTLVANFKDITEVVDVTTGDIVNLKDKIENAFDSATLKNNGIDKAKQAFNELYEKAKQLSSLKISKGRLVNEKDVNQIEEIDRQYKNLRNTYDALHDSFKQEFGDNNYLSDLNDITTQTEEKLKIIQAHIQDVSGNQISKLQRNAKNAIKTFELKNSGNSFFKEVEQEVNELKLSIDKLKNQSGLDDFNQKLNKIQIDLNNFSKDNALGGLFKNPVKFNNFDELVDNLRLATVELGTLEEKSVKIKGPNKLTAEFKQLDGSIKKCTISLDSQGFARFADNGVKHLSRLEKSANGVVKALKGIAGIYVSPSDLISYGRQGFDAVKEIDTSMTELRKVSDATDGQIADYFGQAIESAKNLGSTVNDMIGATADWSRMGMKYCPVM